MELAEASGSGADGIVVGVGAIPAAGGATSSTVPGSRFTKFPTDDVSVRGAVTPLAASLDFTEDSVSGGDGRTVGAGATAAVVWATSSTAPGSGFTIRPIVDFGLSS